MAAVVNARLSATDPVALGPYRLLSRLGGGGMGQVYLGRSPGGRLVAVKVIKPEFAASPEFRMRFAREVATARNVNGMFTAVVADADPDGPVPWLATAYIPGPSLDAAVQESGPLPLASLLPLAAGLAEALAAIHAAGVVHRDLKPSNVLLAADGPRVIDFGISRAAEASRLTQTGNAVGSPGYMSPEQAKGQPVGPASDVFSLGGVLTFAATGEGPFGDGTIHALLYRVVHEPPDLGRVPPELRPLLQRCLAKDPAARPSPGELLAELDGAPIHESWLPQAVAGTLARYQPSARLAALAAGAPGAAEPTSDAVPVSAGPTGPAGPAGPPLARHPQRDTPRSSLRGRAVTAAGVAAVVALALWAGLGTNLLGARAANKSQPPAAGGSAATAATPSRSQGTGRVTPPPATQPPPTGRATATGPAAPTETATTGHAAPTGTATTGHAAPTGTSAPIGPAPTVTVTQSAAASSFPCTDAVKGSASVGGTAVTNAGVTIYSAPNDSSAPLETVYTGHVVTGTCNFYTAAAMGYKWYMQVHMGSGGYGYIWIQYLATGFGHNCDDSGTLIYMPTPKGTVLPATFTSGSRICTLLPYQPGTPVKTGQ